MLAARSEFERLILPHLGAGYSLARWLLRHPQDAEDAVQDATLKAFNAFHGYAGGNAQAWFLAIVRNTCLTLLERRRSETKVVVLGDAHPGVDWMRDIAPDPAPLADAALVSEEERRKIWRGIAALPVQYREVLVLREYHDLSYREIADVVGAPVGTVMSRLSRARERLAIDLAELNKIRNPNIMTRMDCNEVRDLIQAYDDGELPAGERNAVATHVQGCADCSRALADLQRLRATIRASGTFAKPAHLDGRIRAAIGLEGQRRPARNWRGLTKMAASHVAAVALGCALAYGAFARSDARTAAARDIVTAHIRSLIAEQLVHVASADTHTVKPWFVGRVPFSPDVRDLASMDFSLIGARQDYVLDRPAAAIVYGRRKHRINLFILPADTTSHAVEVSQASRNGYNLVAWNSGGFSYFATSDLNAAELAEFASVLRNNTAK